MAQAAARPAAKMYSFLKAPKDLAAYNLMRGVTDFSNLAQFDLFETGYAFLITITRPKMLAVMAKNDDGFAALLESYEIAIEREFKNLDGIEDMTAETSTISNGITEISVITKVVRPAGHQVSMRFNEKSGGLFTKVHEAFLRGIKDPNTEVKRYNGFLDAPEIDDAGYEKECWTYLYVVTDNTFRKLEKAFLLCNCQPTKSETSMYNFEKGDIQFKEVTVEMNCFSITSNMVDLCAKTFLEMMNDETNDLYMEVNSWRAAYQGTNSLRDRAKAYGANFDYEDLPGPVNASMPGTSLRPARLDKLDTTALYDYGDYSNTN